MEERLELRFEGISPSRQGLRNRHLHASPSKHPDEVWPEMPFWPRLPSLMVCKNQNFLKVSFFHVHFYSFRFDFFPTRIIDPVGSSFCSIKPVIWTVFKYIEQSRAQPVCRCRATGAVKDTGQARE